MSSSHEPDSRGVRSPLPAPPRPNASSAASRWLLRRPALTALELLGLLAWAALFAQPLLVLDPNLLPVGKEFPSAIRANHVWLQMQQCGACALWNGDFRGGAPSFADPFGSMLHPVVILNTLLWGVVNGSKMTILAALAMAGWAQWWLARELGLGWLPRLWSAAMAVVGGHLIGRMENGLVGLILSIAACSLVFPAYMALRRTGSLRHAVLLGLTLGLAALAGQGYMQIGLALTLGLAVPLFWLWNDAPGWLMVRRLALAAGLALLIAAPFLVPFLHFSPQFTKNADLDLQSVQPLRFAVLNLVIDDFEFYLNSALDKTPYPWMYVNYIGLVPVALAAVGLLRAGSGQERRRLLFLAGVAAAALWFASGSLQLWLKDAFPALAQRLTQVRYPPLFAFLSVPPILALAAAGVQRSLDLLGPGRRPGLDLRWLLAVPLAFAIASGWSFGRQFMQTTPLGPEVGQLLEALRTPDLQWVAPPFGEHYWTELAVGMGLKQAESPRGWDWDGRPFPPPVRAATRGGPPEGMGPEPLAVVGDIAVYAAPPGREYARVVHADGGATVCAAHGRGGDIDVRCALDRPGTLAIYENSWRGWRATVGGQPAPLRETGWMELDLPAGEHTVALRYRPWDVPLGAALGLVGLALAGYLLWRSERGAYAF